MYLHPMQKLRQKRLLPLFKIVKAPEKHLHA